MLINLRNALMAGERKPTAKDYVQSGLVAMWDGIENAGWGTHDPNATTWKDLVGNTDLSVVDGSFGDKYMYIPLGVVGASNPTAFAKSDIKTIEFVFSVPDGYVMEQGISMPMLIDTGTSKSVARFAEWMGNYCSDEYVSSPRIYQIATSSALSIAHNYSFSYVTENVGNNPIFRDAVQLTGGVTWNRTTASVGYVRVCGSWGNVQLNTARIYSRVLTADEIARNYAIDKARFNLP